MFLGRRKQTDGFLHSSWTWRANLNKCLVQPRRGTSMGNQVRTRCRWPTMLESTRRKKKQKTAQRISLSLDNRGPHKCSAWHWLRLWSLTRGICLTQVSLPAPLRRRLKNLSVCRGFRRPLCRARRFRHGGGRHHDMRIRRVLPHHPRTTGVGIRWKGVELTAIVGRSMM